MGIRQRTARFNAKMGVRGQAIVEFMLVLPVLLLLIFMIIALGRLLHAWLAVENGARFAVRYAVTGEYDQAYFDQTVCDNFYTPFGETCDTEDEKENAARVLSIRDAAEAGSAAILRDVNQTWDQPAFYQVTLCSTRANPGFVYHPSDTNEWVTDWSSDCTPYHDAGGPGNRVVVTVDFNHPVIVPFLSNIAPWLHLTATREGRVEQFRVSRVVGIDPTLVLPSPTPLPTNTPTETHTPLPSATPSDTPTASITPTASDTPTASPTASETPLPSCTNVYLDDPEDMSFGLGTTLTYKMHNDSYPGLELTGFSIWWEALEDTRTVYDWESELDYIRFATSEIFDGGDENSSTSGNKNMPVSVPLGESEIFVDFDNVDGLARLTDSPIFLDDDNFGFALSFNDSDCDLTKSFSGAVFPAPTDTPTPTLTFTPSNTPLPTNTPLPSNTPSSTPIPSATPIPSNTPTPSDTPVPSATPVPSDTPLPSATPVPSATPFPSDTPLPSPTFTPSPTNTAGAFG